MQHSYIDHRTNLQKNRSNTNKSNFVNFVKVNNEEDHYGKVSIEANFLKDGKILIRSFSINKLNLGNILTKFKNNGFEVRLSKSIDDTIIAPSIITNNHPEYKNNNNFLRNSFQLSFNQKFNR